MTEDPMGGREVEDDHDLLTYNEAGARLREELRLTRDELAALDGPDNPRRAELERRLELLQGSAERNDAQSAEDTDARGFLEYAPDASESE
jgi:hypothetical protein